MSTCRFLLSNGVISRASDAPTVTSFLETHPGAYTTTRTHNDGSYILFWGRHLNRLISSAKILLNSDPRLLFGSSWPADASSASSMALSAWELGIPDLVNDSTRKVLPRAMRDREMGQELAITVLLGGNLESLRKSVHVDRKRVDGVLDVHVHVSAYVPPVFGARQSGARLALVGRGRSVAAAKYSDWVRLRKPLERLRPPSVTELLLSDDGDHILEGTITNFFVVCRKDIGEDNGKGVYPGTNIYSSFKVQTAPVRDGVLPGVLRQLVIEVCLSKGIPIQELAPSWSMHELWEEAFITNGLRLLQHVDTILVPSEHASLESRTYKEVSWKETQFQVCECFDSVIRCTNLALVIIVFSHLSFICWKPGWSGDDHENDPEGDHGESNVGRTVVGFIMTLPKPKENASKSPASVNSRKFPFFQ